MVKEEQEKYGKIILTLDQLRELGKELIEAGSKEAFLVNRKIIRVIDKTWHVISYEGLADANREAYGGYLYQTDTPYTFWNIAINQVENYLRRKERAEKARLANKEPKENE